jgi:hypothetical protein
MAHVSQGAPRVTTVHDAIKEMIRAHLTLVHILHVSALADNLWVAHALSHLGIHEVWYDSFHLSNT